MDNIELQEELFAQLRALGCAFSFSKENKSLTVEYANTKKSCIANEIDDEFYNKMVKIVKSYYINAKVVENQSYNTKFQLG